MTIYLEIHHYFNSYELSILFLQIVFCKSSHLGRWGHHRNLSFIFVSEHLAQQFQLTHIHPEECRWRRGADPPKKNVAPFCSAKQKTAVAEGTFSMRGTKKCISLLMITHLRFVIPVKVQSCCVPRHQIIQTLTRGYKRRSVQNTRKISWKQMEKKRAKQFCAHSKNTKVKSPCIQ